MCNEPEDFCGEGIDEYYSEPLGDDFAEMNRNEADDYRNEGESGGPGDCPLSTACDMNEPCDDCPAHANDCDGFCDQYDEEGGEKGWTEPPIKGGPEDPRDAYDEAMDAAAEPWINRFCPGCNHTNDRCICEQLERLETDGGEPFRG